MSTIGDPIVKSLPCITVIMRAMRQRSRNGSRDNRIAWEILALAPGPFHFLSYYNHINHINIRARARYEVLSSKYPFNLKLSRPAVISKL